MWNFCWETNGIQNDFLERKGELCLGIQECELGLKETKMMWKATQILERRGRAVQAVSWVVGSSGWSPVPYVAVLSQKETKHWVDRQAYTGDLKVDLCLTFSPLKYWMNSFFPYSFPLLLYSRDSVSRVNSCKIWGPSCSVALFWFLGAIYSNPVCSSVFSLLGPLVLKYLSPQVAWGHLHALSPVTQFVHVCDRSAAPESLSFEM